MNVSNKRQAGLTLVELLVGVAIVAVLLGVGAPAMTSLQRSNSLLSESYALRASLNQARSEAMAQRTFVTVCSSVDGSSCGGSWSDGFIVFSDSDGDSAFDPGSDELLMSRDINHTHDLSISATGKREAIRFDASGFARAFATNIVFCDGSGSSDPRAIVVAASGSVSSAVSGQDGSLSVPGGTVSCGA